jgi:3-oxoacyl-[acyl-carrier protein] reductase
MLQGEELKEVAVRSVTRRWHRPPVSAAAKQAFAYPESSHLFIRTECSRGHSLQRWRDTCRNQVYGRNRNGGVGVFDNQHELDCLIGYTVPIQWRRLALAGEPLRNGCAAVKCRAGQYNACGGLGLALVPDELALTGMNALQQSPEHSANHDNVAISVADIAPVILARRSATLPESSSRIPSGNLWSMAKILVTGASGGIGAAISKALAARGVTVVLHYQNGREAAETTRRSLKGDGHTVVQADLSDAKAIERLWKEVSANQRIDAVVNNAGIFPYHPPLTTDFEDWVSAWQRTLGTNLFGPAHLSYFAARTMVEQGGGRIVNISSRGAFRGEPNAPAYGASKAGLNAFSQSLAKALAPKGVYVYVVAPGWVATDRVAKSVTDPAVLADQPLGRVATPEEVAEVATFCTMDAPASLTGAILDVNGASYLRS